MSSSSKGFHIGLWVVQILLGLACIAAGLNNLTSSIEDMVKSGATFAADMPWLPRFIGASLFAGGLGLILPAATRILPILTPIAGVMLVIVMILAVGYHVVIEGQASHSGPAVVFGALAAFVAWGRFLKAPITAR